MSELHMSSSETDIMFAFCAYRVSHQRRLFVLLEDKRLEKVVTTALDLGFSVFDEDWSQQWLVVKHWHSADKYHF